MLPLYTTLQTRLWRGGRDLNPRGMLDTPTHLAGGRTRPGYATSPQACARQPQAEGEGFEPPVTCATVVFKTTALDRSAIPPSGPDHILFLRQLALSLSEQDSTNDLSLHTSSINGKGVV